LFLSQGVRLNGVNTRGFGFHCLWPVKPFFRKI
jgi:hypothetical protein